MKKVKELIVILCTGMLLISCFDLDLNPLSEGSSDNWYSTETELTMSVRFMYASKYWGLDSFSCSPRFIQEHLGQ
mgnify:CR=1 FL=1